MKVGKKTKRILQNLKTGYENLKEGAVEVGKFVSSSSSKINKFTTPIALQSQSAFAPRSLSFEEKVRLAREQAYNQELGRHEALEELRRREAIKRDKERTLRRLRGIGYMPPRRARFDFNKIGVRF